MGASPVDGTEINTDAKRTTNLCLDLVYGALWNVDLFDVTFKDLKRAISGQEWNSLSVEARPKLVNGAMTSEYLKRTFKFYEDDSFDATFVYYEDP